MSPFIYEKEESRGYGSITANYSVFRRATEMYLGHVKLVHGRWFAHPEGMIQVGPGRPTREAAARDLEGMRGPLRFQYGIGSGGMARLRRRHVPAKRTRRSR